LIETFSGGDIIFLNHSSAGTATLHAHSFGGFIDFQGNSDASGARIITDLGSTVDFSTDAGPLGNGNFAGSIEGAGQFAIGGRSLKVGGNNLSTTFSGTIQGNPGAALVKVGTGTLTQLPQRRRHNH